MNRLRYILLVLLVVACDMSQAQDAARNYYWVAFIDKNGTPHSVLAPETYLSQRAIARRQRQQIQIDETDLPVSPVYLSGLKNLGAEIIHSSKWLNGATIRATADLAGEISRLEFIRELQLTKPALTPKSAKDKFAREQISDLNVGIDTSYYGPSVYQIGQLSGQFLHNQNINGQGLHIAVLDAGFFRADELPAFLTLWNEGRVLGFRDFVSPGTNIFAENQHGMNVLSIMAGDLPGSLIGSAPGASYYLFRTEDSASEYLIEEDNWAFAAEYADSLGVDVINSSLGYTEFDDAGMNHSYTDMNGETTRVTRAANLAVKKGMLVFSSAGNEADGPWRYLSAPADGDLVLGVGAVDRNGIWAPFSSLGLAADGLVKPNVAALGWGTVLQRNDGTVGLGSGTSFSSPVMAGMAACLWQSNPLATAQEIKQALEESASQYTRPDNLLGYGIPDMELADRLLKRKHGVEQLSWVAVPNPLQTSVYLYKLDGPPETDVLVRIYRTNGSLVYEKVFPAASPVFIPNLSNLPGGLYIASLRYGSHSAHVKLMVAGQ
ncbi:MAG: S8 family serine peptidase [Mangrovibacterium sp.]